MPSSSWAFTFIPQKRWRNTTEKKLCANHWFDIAYSDLEWHIDINSDWFLFIIVPGKADESAGFHITTNMRQLQTKKMWPICSSLYFCPLKSFILNLFHSNSSEKFHASIWFGAQPPRLLPYCSIWLVIYIVGKKGHLFSITIRPSPVWSVFSWAPWPLGIIRMRLPVARPLVVRHRRLASHLGARKDEAAEASGPERAGGTTRGNPWKSPLQKIDMLVSPWRGMMFLKGNVRKIFQPSVFQGISGYFQGH